VGEKKIDEKVTVTGISGNEEKARENKPTKGGQRLEKLRKARGFTKNRHDKKVAD